jgi:hypothetical protein
LPKQELLAIREAHDDPDQEHECYGPDDQRASGPEQLSLDSFSTHFPESWHSLRLHHFFGNFTQPAKSAFFFIDFKGNSLDRIDPRAPDWETVMASVGSLLRNP